MSFQVNHLDALLVLSTIFLIYVGQTSYGCTKSLPPKTCGNPPASASQSGGIYRHVPPHPAIYLFECQIAGSRLPMATVSLFVVSPRVLCTAV